MTKWPKDNQAARNAFYGDPAKGEIGPQMVPVVPPFAMYYTTDAGVQQHVKSIMFHRKCADALLAALNEIWDFCQHDQAKIDASGVSKYAGAYNPRKVRGSATKWSNHAYAAAIDLNAEENSMYAKGNMPHFVIDAFCRQGAMWGGWYTGRLDPMHFEFVDNGGRKPLSPIPVYAGAVAVPVGIMSNAPADELEDVKPDSDVIGDPFPEPSDGPFDTFLKLIKSKTAWASTALGGISLSSILGFLTDWKTILAIGSIGLVGYIIYERSKKP